MSTLHLSLRGEYFDAIKAGTKPEEYRLVTPYWRKRLEGRSYSQITLTKGYPAADDHARRLTLPWRGFTVKTIQHAFFGPAPVEVFAIDVSGVLAGGDRKPSAQPQVLDPQSKTVVTGNVEPCPYASYCNEEGLCANGCEIRQRINSARGVPETRDA